MPAQGPPQLPEVRQVRPGETHSLCRCGRSQRLPDCSRGCPDAFHLHPQREQRLLLCRCGRSRNLPYCDGSHMPPARGWRARWRRFWGHDGLAR